ncbi:WD40-repeat-containing domain protein [Aspergillus pseudoustus]|uniref:WD40-repeat-containing domain protein n=1 Tax=Aspergillus pseudoustus TaxID=1810923 RepID=A0ABR4IMZ1_9EURO
MSTTDYPSPARLAKRSRASDAAAPGNTTNIKKERAKRRRASTAEEESTERFNPTTSSILMPSETTKLHPTFQVSESNNDTSSSWSLSRGTAGQFSSLDPALTPDEQYLFLGLETSIHVYSIATSRLFRILEQQQQQSASETIVGFRLSPINQERLYIFTSSGSVTEWDWAANRQLARWSIIQHKTTIAADVVFENRTTDPVLFSLGERKDGKRDLAITPLNDNKNENNMNNERGVSILETSVKIEGFRIVGDGQIVVAYGGTHLFLGVSSSAQDLESSSYAWREVKLGANITCVDITLTTKLPEFDLAVGGADGSILVYHGALGLLGLLPGKRDEDRKKSTPRRLHWHRDAVTAVHWSRDGNYLISGGHESVMVLWQLDTGRKQFLPHLSSPICNIIVSSSGNSYAVKLADNRVVVLSARELQPLATITGLQLCARAPTKTPSQAGTTALKHLQASRAVVAAALHPQHPEQLLITVPASHQLSQLDSTITTTGTTASVLQTYDIRSNSHIARQALARTNATTLNISPDGTQIVTPDIKHMSISQDGKWMATVDSWSPYPQDMEALGLRATTNHHHHLRSSSEYDEVFIKFWRWSGSSGLWELVTRIDKPHLSDRGSAASVLSMSARPRSHEFATIGSDALLRVWRPVIRQRYGSSKKNKDSNTEPHQTWKCRHTVDLSGYLETPGSSCSSSSAFLTSAASVCFSEDGSVLAVCLQSTSSSTNPGTILLDVQSGSVRHSKAGVYFGSVCATSFLGRHLVIATTRSVFVWDTVNDTVKSTDPSPEVQSSLGSRLLAVNNKTHNFAIASTRRTLQKKAGSSKVRKSGHYIVQVFDVDSLSVLSRIRLSKEPVALLSNPHSTEYVVVDAGANVQQLGCEGNKASQPVNTDDMIEYTDLGLSGLFGRQSTGAATNRALAAPVVTAGHTQPSERTGLASVFGDTPPFVLPPSRIVFRDLVKALAV